MSDELDDAAPPCGWRAAHRGTKEMDFCSAVMPRRPFRHGRAGAGPFEQSLALPDPDLQQWLLEGDGMRKRTSPIWCGRPQVSRAELMATDAWSALSRRRGQGRGTTRSSLCCRAQASTPG